MKNDLETEESQQFLAFILLRILTKRIAKATRTIIDWNCFSQAASYIQVLMISKPKPVLYRFCLNYRVLNRFIKSFSWRVPIIREFLQRLGCKRNGYFGVIDLALGYHQASITR